MATGPYGLTYVWACSLFDGVQTDPCRDANDEELVLPGTAVITLPAGTLSETVGAAYQFTVTVSKAGRSPASRTVPVTVVLELLPLVEVSTAQGIFEADGSRTINAGDKLLLTSTCDITPNVRQWRFSPSIDLSTEWMGQSTAELMKGEGGHTLVPGTLYTVTHSCTADGVEGTSSLEVYVNQPPTGGSCSICQWESASECTSNLNAPFPIISSFRTTCTGWSDPDGTD
eukprot:2116669-Rhodomonas_salina.1